MDGQIRVKSQPGQGSCFHLTLPVQPVQAPPEMAETAALQPAASSRSLQILLAEDHPINQRLAMTLLARWGHTVVLAQNGMEAVEHFDRQPWDLILMDMQMPVMGGLDATRAVRAAEAGIRHTPIVAMTANAMEADRIACLEAGMDAFMAKPFEAAKLKALLEEVAAGMLTAERRN